jgi:hypothetical protein
LLGLQGEGLGRSLLGWFAWKRKKEKGIDMAKVCMAEFKFEFEFFQTRFEN